MQSVSSAGKKKHATYTKRRKARITQATFAFAFAPDWLEYSERCPDQGLCCYLASVLHKQNLGLRQFLKVTRFVFSFSSLL